MGNQKEPLIFFPPSGWSGAEALGEVEKGGFERLPSGLLGRPPVYAWSLLLTLQKWGHYPK